MSGLMGLILIRYENDYLRLYIMKGLGETCIFLTCVCTEIALGQSDGGLANGLHLFKTSPGQPLKPQDPVAAVPWGPQWWLWECLEDHSNLVPALCMYI